MNTKIRITIVACALAITTLVTTLWFYQSNKSNRQDTLVVGMMSGWAPFMNINANGQYEGFDVDVAERIAEKLGKKLVIKDFGSLAPTFIALEQGSIDLVMSGLDITQARRNSMIMIPYTGGEVNQFALLFWQEIPREISTIDDLAAQKAIVCVEPGSGQAKFLDSIPDIVQKPLGKLEEMVLDIKYGKSRAMLVEPRVAKRLAKRAPELQALAVPLPADFVVYGCGIAVSKKRDDLAKKATAVIDQMRADGSLATLEKKWQLEE